jgi:hypothetical protein
LSFSKLSSSANAITDLKIQVNDGLNTAETNYQVILPGENLTETVTTTASGSMVFGQFSNGQTYKIYKSLLNSDINSHINIGTDVQALADHLSGKLPITGAGLAAADYDGSGVVNMTDGAALIKGILQGDGSELVLVDSSGSSSITLAAGGNFTLSGVVLGDLDASYASAL